MNVGGLPDMLSDKLIAVSFDDLIGWHDDDHLAALNCFHRSTNSKPSSAYLTKSLGVNGRELSALKKPNDLSKFNQFQAKQYFVENFQPFKFDISPEKGLLTGYYEPQIDASAKRTERFCYPLYARPDDLIEIDAENRPPYLDESYVFAKISGGNISEYYDRGEIQTGALAGRGLELYWLDNPIDVFFIHIQGSACLNLQDGQTVKIAYAAKSGHPYTPIGKLLVKMGAMELKDVSMNSIRRWLLKNPKQIEQVFSANRSYIFFKTNTAGDNKLGPVGAASISLMDGRSLAVDHQLHTFGTPIWISPAEESDYQSFDLPRLCIAQDTGSAIVGPQRADVFIGSGERAGQIAGNLRQSIEMIVFVPRQQLR